MSLSTCRSSDIMHAQCSKLSAYSYRFYTSQGSVATQVSQGGVENFTTEQLLVSYPMYLPKIIKIG